MADYRTGHVAGSVVDLNQLSRGIADLNGFVTRTSGAGAVTISTGLTVNVAAIAQGAVMLAGVLNSTGYAGSTVTLDVADATNPRRDIIYWNGTTVTKLSGTAAANPALPTTSFTPATMLILAEVLVGAGVTELVAANITDKRQFLANTRRVIYRGTAEYTSVSTSAVDLVTISSIYIPSTMAFTVACNAGKTSGAAAQATLGLKLNSTVVNEAATGGTPIWLSGATNEAQNGNCYVTFHARNASPYRAVGLGSYVWQSGTGGNSPAFFRGGASGNISNSAITSISVRGTTDSASVTVSAHDIVIWMEAY